MLSWHSRLATDDYSFIWDVYNNGIIKGTYNQYMLWCGRYAAKFLFYIVYKYLDADQTWYFLLPLLSLGLLLSGVYKAITNIISHYNFPFSLQKTVAILFTALLFFMTIDIGETWFWYNSFGDYLWSVIAFTWGTAFLFSRSKRSLSTMAAVLCFIYVGGASEVYSLVFGQLFLALIYKGLKQHNYKRSYFLQDAFSRKIIIVSVFFLISFLITVIAPGNYERTDHFPKPHFISTISLSAYMFGKLLFWFLPQKMLYIIAFASPFLIIGKQYNKGNKIPFKEFLKNIRTVSLLLLMNCLLIFGLIAFLMSVSGEYRIWFILSFLLSIYFCGICFYAGYKGLINEKSLAIVKKTSASIGLIVMIYTLTDQYIITKKYATAQDERIAFLVDINQHIQKDTMITVPQLPPSGMLYSAEITDNADDFLNEELKQGYRLKFHVVIEKKVP